MDPSLLEKARNGDAAALEAVLHEIAPSVHRFGLRMCRNEHDAEDVVQDTLLAVARELDHFEGRSSLSTWVFTLARTACARKRRGMKNRPHISSDGAPEPPDEAGGPEESAARSELADALSRALESLSVEHREVLLLRDVEGLTAPEAAEALGITVEALKSRLHRARAALREAMRPVMEAPEPKLPGCPDIVEALSRKLEGDLDALDCSAMERHIAECPACRARCDGLRGALAACASARTAPVPREVKARVEAALRQARTRPGP